MNTSTITSGEWTARGRVPGVTPTGSLAHRSGRGHRRPAVARSAGGAAFHGNDDCYCSVPLNRMKTQHSETMSHVSGSPTGSTETMSHVSGSPTGSTETMSHVSGSPTGSTETMSHVSGSPTGSTETMSHVSGSPTGSTETMSHVSGSPTGSTETMSHVSGSPTGSTETMSHVSGSPTGSTETMSKAIGVYGTAPDRVFSGACSIPSVVGKPLHIASHSRDENQFARARPALHIGVGFRRVRQ